MARTRENAKRSSRASAAAPKKINKQGVKSSAFNGFMTPCCPRNKNARENGSEDRSAELSGDVLATEDGHATATGDVEGELVGRLSGIPAGIPSSMNCAGLTTVNGSIRPSSERLSGCVNTSTPPTDISTPSSGTRQNKLPPLNDGTVLLLQELLLSHDQDRMYQTFPGDTGLLLGSIPLFGVAVFQPPQARKTIMRSWHWRHFILSDEGDDEEFRKTLRVPRRAFWRLLNIVETDLIRKQTNWCMPLSSAIQLCVYLYYAGHGCSLQQLSSQFGIGRSTASGIIRCVSESITSRMENWIHFPDTRDELLNLSRVFEETHRLPGCVAAIDGCHISITQPAVSKSHKFYNRKGFYSINMSAAVDHRRRFLDVDIRWPGSVGDSRVFNNSELGRRHEAVLCSASGVSGAGAMQVGWYSCERVPFYLLADSAYANTTYVVTTFEIAEAQKDIVVARLNHKLTGMRYTVECAFGILKGRWRLLMKPIEMARTNLHSVPTVVGSLCILHNFLIEYGDEVWNEEDERRRETYYDANYLSISSVGSASTTNSKESTRDVLLRWMRFFDSVRSAS